MVRRNTAIKKRFKELLPVSEGCKIGELDQETLTLCSLILFQMISSRKNEIMAIGEIKPGAGICLSSIVSLWNSVKCIMPTFLADDTFNQIEGLEEISVGSAVALVQDVLHDASSLLRAIEQLENQNFKVEVVLSIIDCQEGAQELLAEHGIKLMSIFTLEDFCS